jgi:23S rRNA-/tRNA-specific pseudouridylate synthase
MATQDVDTTKVAPTTEQPKNSIRITITLSTPRSRIDQVLIEELRKQTANPELKNISRTAFKELFKNKKVRIKGQSAVPSSSLAKGTTYVDILL